MWQDSDVKTWKRADRGGIYYVQVPGRAGWVSSNKASKRAAVEWALQEASGGVRSDITIAAYTANFFIPDKCPLIKMQEARGKSNTVKHWRTMHQLMRDYIWPAWGRYTFAALQPRDVFAWLSGLKRTRAVMVDGKPTYPPMADQSKNKVLVAFHEILDHAVFDGVIMANTLRSVPRMINQAKPRDVFDLAELRKLFPADRIELCRIWGDLRTAVLYLVAADTGLRPQEVAALDWADYYPDLGGFIVHRATTEARTIKALKTAGKGVSRKPALVGTRAAEYLKELQPKPAKGLVFPAPDSDEKRGQLPIRVDTMGKRFLDGLESAQVPRNGRVLYCLRHTFNTAARSLLGDDSAVRSLMGHTTAEMTANYDHPDDAALLLRVQGQREKLENRWKV